MSDNISIRPPTWEGLAPTMPEWELASEDVVMRMLNVLGYDGTIWSAKFGGVLSSRMYRFDRSDGRKFVLKVVEPKGVGQSNAAEEVGAWLSSKNVPVVVATDQYSLPSGEVLVAMPYLEGRRVGLEENELFTLGASLAKLHGALKKAPCQGRWRENTAKRLKVLSKTRSHIVSRGAKFGPDPQRLLKLAIAEELNFEKSGWSAQPLHGDLNPGNVLVVNDSPVFIDFEDTVHSVLAVEYEILFAIERFVLVRVKDDIEAIHLGREFLRGYNSQTSRSYVESSIDPVIVLRSLALRSLMVLAHGEFSKISVSENEWRKFFYLEQMSSCRAEVISKIFEG